jgi:signal transduction histidine kinase
MTDAFRRAERPAERRILGGVAAGLSDHLRVPVVWIRVGFVVATWLNGAGLIAYLLLWRFLPLAEPERSAGLESAERRGLRLRGSRIGGREIIQTLAVLALGAGVLVLLQVTGRGVSQSFLLPTLVAVVGIAVIWRQLDDAALAQWVRQTSGVGSALRIASGIALVVVAAVYFVTQERGWGALIDLGSAAAIALIGAGLILGPWVLALLGDLGRERSARIRSQERADVAAHLHDSVLQTLALLQRNADDPAAVAALARRQERDLRTWLYGEDAPDGESLVASLRQSAAEVEDAHRVPIEVVAVGDVTLNADTVALARATREAMVNAAKHAQVDRIDVYSESDGRQVDVFIRDRGVGFDPSQIPADRMGIRTSITDRVERHGGNASIKTASGEGTEVHLTMPIRATAESQS